jgi:lambda family phage tail tape measure protein
MADDEEEVSKSLGGALDMTKELRSTTDALGKSITGAFAQGVVQGRRFEDVLRSIGQRMISFGLRAALKPVESSLQSLLGSLLGGSSGGGSSGGAGLPLSILPNARGAAFRFGRVTPFAAGGVVAAPTYFPMRGGLGLMGERGPEAIMPLTRGADGKLGVQADSGRSVTVTMNVMAQDVANFRRSEAQIAGALARAVSRGRRST